MKALLAEFIGTLFLVATVVGSGIMAVQLTDDVGLQLLINSLATGGILIAMIVALQSISADFNPAVTLVAVALKRTPARAAIGLIAAQIAGGIAGTVLANLMFNLDAITWSDHERSGGGLWLGEAVATFGLVLVIFALLQAGRVAAVAYGVAAYIVAAYWFTSSTSFANPAVAVARMFTDTFAGIDPASVAMFVLMQLIGAALALVTIRILWEKP